MDTITVRLIKITVPTIRSNCGLKWLRLKKNLPNQYNDRAEKKNFILFFDFFFSQQKSMTAMTSEHD
jgi:hypothetical protein